MQTFSQYAATRLLREHPARAQTFGGVAVRTGSIQTYAGIDLITGMPVFIYTMPEKPNAIQDVYSEFIPTVLEIGFEHDVGFMVTASAPGYTPLKPTLTTPRLEWLLRVSSRALADAHSAGLIHGNLEPSHFFVCGDHLLLEGWGLPWGDAIPDYKPAETTVSLASDVFAWARCMSLFGKGKPRHMLDGEYGRLIGHCLNARPSERPNAQELVLALEQILNRAAETKTENINTDLALTKPEVNESAKQENELVKPEIIQPVTAENTEADPASPEAKLDAIEAELALNKPFHEELTRVMQTPEDELARASQTNTSEIEPVVATELETVASIEETTSTEPKTPEPEPTLDLSVTPERIPQNEPRQIKVPELLEKTKEEKIVLPATSHKPDLNTVLFQTPSQIDEPENTPPLEPEPVVAVESVPEQTAEISAEPIAEAAQFSEPEHLAADEPDVVLPQRASTRINDDSDVDAPRPSTNIRIGFDEEDQSWRHVVTPSRNNNQMGRWIALAVVIGILIVAAGIFLGQPKSNNNGNPQRINVSGSNSSSSVVTFNLRGAEGIKGRLLIVSAPNNSKLEKGALLATVPGPVAFPVSGEYKVRIEVLNYQPAEITVRVPQETIINLELSSMR